MTQNTIVSAIIPVYNGEKYLSEAIESLLDQSYQPIEILIVDNGSTDKSAQIAQSYLPKIQYYYLPEPNGIKAKNFGITQSKGQFISFLDADDIWEKDKTHLQLAAFKQEPTLDAVFGLVQQFISPELDSSLKQKYKFSNELMRGYHQSAMLIKREALFKVGLFNETWEVGEFLDWYQRSQEMKLKLSLLNSIVFNRRLHPSNMGITKKHSRHDYLKILKTGLDRRRTINK